MAYLDSATSRLALTAPQTIRDAATEAALEQSPVRTGRFRAVGWTILGFVSVVLLAGVMAHYGYEGNRHADELSEGSLGETERRVAQRIRAYVEPIVVDFKKRTEEADGRNVLAGGLEIARLAARRLADIPSATKFTYADSLGNSVSAIRDERGQFRIKMVDRGRRQVTSYPTLDGPGDTVPLKDEEIDPRKEPWYQEAETSNNLSWTDAYLLPGSGKPAVMLSFPKLGGSDAKPLGMMSLEFELGPLADILREETSGNTRKALIVDKDGRIVAYPSGNWLKPGAKPPTLDEVGDPMLILAYGQWPLKTRERKVLEFAGERILVSAQSLRRTQDWQVLTYAPAPRGGGILPENPAVQWIVAAAGVAFITGALAWHGIRADRRATASAVRQRALERRVESLGEIARDATAADGSSSELQTATVSIAHACSAKRVAVWRLTFDGRTLRCEDCFDRTAGDHTSGLELHREDLHGLFVALTQGRPIETTDAEHDPRTSELFASYLSPLEINSVYIEPLGSGSNLLGMLTVEAPLADDHASGLPAYCYMLSILLVARLGGKAPSLSPRAAPRGELPGPDGSADPGSNDDVTRPRIQLERTMIAKHAALDALGDSAFERAAIGVVKLPVWTTVVQRPAGQSDGTIMDSIVLDLLEVIETSGLDYAALLDDQIILGALGRQEGAEAANALCMAGTMLQLRDRLVALEHKWAITLDFRLAMDVGMAVSSTVSKDPLNRNLWGGAVGVAQILARTAPQRTISTSEAAYERLSSQFLFRPRGSYFLPEAGNMRTFVLVRRVQ